MDLDFTPDQLEFRDQVRTWLDENKPAEPRPRDDAGIREYDLAWQRTQAEGGWAGIAWPTEYGGKGLTLLQQLIWYEEYAARGFPGIDACFVGNSHAGPTLITRATDEQKSFHLPKILGGEVIWCQGFSEPGAGSDLAALRTKAVIDGEYLVVSGQKLWTSFATVADYQELLVRTDNTGSKHKGITWVICDMSAPGIDVRPIETIEGGSEFCEVFYDDVRIPLSNVVGDVGEGWSVAMATLSFERGTAFTANQVRLAKIIEDLIDYARDHVGPDGRRPAIADDEIARRLARARASVASLRALTYTNICEAMKTETPGPRGSIVKLMYAELAKEIGKLAMDVVGPASVRHSSRWDVDGWVGYYYYSFSQAIGGGTSEIQRNIVGERVLGLPQMRGHRRWICCPELSNSKSSRPRENSSPNGCPSNGFAPIATRKRRCPRRCGENAPSWACSRSDSTRSPAGQAGPWTTRHCCSSNSASGSRPGRSWPARWVPGWRPVVATTRWRSGSAPGRPRWPSRYCVATATCALSKALSICSTPRVPRTPCWWPVVVPLWSTSIPSGRWHR